MKLIRDSQSIFRAYKGISPIKENTEKALYGGGGGCYLLTWSGLDTQQEKSGGYYVKFISGC